MRRDISLHTAGCKERVEVVNTTTPIVHLVDDDASFLNAVSRLLRASGFEVRAFASASDFLSQYHAETHGCLIVDLRMPGITGLDVQAAVGRTDNPLPVIFLTGEGDIQTSVRAMRNGAEDFLEKRAPKEQLLAAVQRALARNQCERLQRERLRELRARFDALSEREREVLGHVVQGKLNKQIAADLGIHERTVKLHRTAITTKLRAPSVAEITRLAQEAGIFSAGGPTFPKGQ